MAFLATNVFACTRLAMIMAFRRDISGSNLVKIECSEIDPRSIVET